jgi:transcription regulator MmyB-like protein
VRIGSVERGDDLVVVAARLAVAQELHPLDLDLPGLGLRCQQPGGLGDELVKRAQVASLRAAYGSMGPRSRAGELVRALTKVSPEFAGLWDRHEVAKRFEDHKILLHPELGAIEVDCQVLFTEDQSQALLVLTAPPRSEGYEKLQLLAVLGQERFAAAP